MLEVEKVVLENWRKGELGHGGGRSQINCVVDDDSTALLQTPRLSKNTSIRTKGKVECLMTELTSIIP